MLISSLLLTLAVHATAQTPQVEDVLSDPALAKKVTFELNATRMKPALAALSTQSGVQLEAGAQMQTPVLVARATDVPLKEIMARVAKVTGGEWRKRDEVFTLYPDGAVQRREQNEDRAARLKKVQNAVQMLLNALKPKPPKPQGGQKANDADAQVAVEDAMAMAFGGQGSTSKAITRILPMLDQSLIANLDFGERVVWATTPTMTQRQLPGGLGPIFNDLIAEHNKEMANRPRKDEQVEEDEAEKQFREFYEAIFGSRDTDKPITERAAKALLIAGRQEMGFGINLELRLYGAGGKVILSGQSMLPIGEGLLSDAIEMAQAMDPTKAKPAPSGDDKPIEPSPEAKELRTLFSSMTMGGGGGDALTKGFSESLMNKLTRPDLNDPLAIGSGDTVLGLAKVKGLNVVANLPDDMQSMFDMMSGSGGTTANAALASLTSGDATKAEVKDGWLTVWPAEPEKARRERLDRVALARLIGAARAKGTASLDDLAAYSLSARPPMATPVAMVYLSMFASNAVNGGMMGTTDWNMLRLYGTLGLVQRKSLEDGGPLPFSNILLDQRTHLTRMAFGTDARLEVQGQDKPKSPGGFLAIVSRFMPRQTGDYREEPTEAMPSGIPNAGTMSLAVSNDIVGRLAGGGAIAQMAGVVGADELAMLQYMAEDPNMAQFAAMIPKIEGLKLGTRKTYTFTFSVAPGVTFTKVLNDDLVDKNAPVTPMESLPPALKAKIAERVAEFKKNPIPFGIGGQGTIPPR